MKKLQRPTMLNQTQLTDSQIQEAKNEILLWLKTDAEEAMELIMDCYLQNNFDDIIHAVNLSIDFGHINIGGGNQDI
jgi:hypothetical protein